MADLLGGVRVPVYARVLLRHPAVLVPPLLVGQGIPIHTNSIKQMC